jgi:sporulation integral membrane protein YlbJ
MSRGLSLCAHTVIPSLFPFMVISELLVSSGVGEALGRLLAKPMKWIFGLSGAGCSAVILGTMCGFPIGASTAVSLLDKNVISKRECEHLLTFSNNPSSAFLMTAVGVSLFGSHSLGIILYITVLGSALLIGFLMRFLLRDKQNSPPYSEHPHYPSGFHPGGISMFTGAMSHAATGMLTICAYVIFFSALTGALSGMLNSIGGINQVVHTLFCGFFELSGGISEAATLVGETTEPWLPLVLTAVIAGWSGLSVHFQIITICGGRELSFKPYFFAKILHGILSGLLMYITLSLIDPTQLPPVSKTVAAWMPLFNSIQLGITPLSHIGFVLSVWLWIRKRFTHT